MTTRTAVTRLPKDVLRRKVGYLRLYEYRNRVVHAPAALRARAFESSEVRRLRPQAAGRPEALVATVIATYRRPQLLARAVDSALAQSVEDQVVVVVDDGGGLPAVLPDDERLVAVSLEHNTRILGLCRNVGIRLTRSRYIAFLDDDNEWEPHHLETALAELGRGHDLVYTALDRVMPDGSRYDVFSESFDRAAMARGASQADSNAIVVRRGPHTLFSRIPRPREVLPPEDWEFVFRLSRRGRVSHVPEATVRYLVNPESHYTSWDATALHDREEAR